MNLFKPSLNILRSTVFKNGNNLPQFTKLIEPALSRISLARCIHTTSVKRRPLGEFFDDRENIDSENIYVGRPWRKDELRVKSNSDLHKLWYILLKERNMLLTMEQMTYDQQVPFPAPDRIYKVEESMENLMSVLEEWDEVYHVLNPLPDRHFLDWSKFKEVEESMENLMSVIEERDEAHQVLNAQKTGEKRDRVTRNFAGIPMKQRPQQHIKPREFSVTDKLLHPEFKPWMYKHIAKYEQKLRMKYRFEVMLCKRKQKRLLKEFPHLTWDDVAHIKPSDKKLREFLKLAEELNDQDFKRRKVYE